MLIKKIIKTCKKPEKNHENLLKINTKHVPYVTYIPPSRRENFPQTYCLIKKNFLWSSPPDSLYIGKGWESGAPHLLEKIANLRGIFDFFIKKKH